MKPLFSILITAFMALFFGAAAGEATGLDPAIVAGVVGVGSLFVSVPAGSLAMAVTREMWIDRIVANLFKNNRWITLSISEDEYVLQGKIVHQQRAGNRPNVVRNRAVLPAIASKRDDVDILYALAEYSTDPIYITNAEQIEQSPDKIDNILMEHYLQLNQEAADWMLIDWATSTGGDVADPAILLETSGTATVEATAPGATGNRKLFVKEDLKKARKQMNLADIPMEGRVALIPTEMMDQLLDDEDLKKRDSSQELDMREGAITKLYGFDIFERSSVINTTEAGNNLRPPSDAGAATDQESAICWHPGNVARALGDVSFFEDLSNPLYYGDIYSALVRAGGRAKRKNAVCLIKQATAA